MVNKSVTAVSLLYHLDMTINTMIRSFKSKEHQLRFSEVENSIFQRGRHREEASRREPRVSPHQRISKREIKPLERSYPTDKLTRVSLRKARISATRRRSCSSSLLLFSPPRHPPEEDLRGSNMYEVLGSRDQLSRTSL